MSQPCIIEHVDDLAFSIKPFEHSIYVTSDVLISDDCGCIKPNSLFVPGFYKSEILDFGWSQYGYEFYVNHAKWGKITFARGYTHGNSIPDTISEFHKIYCGIENEFDSKDYRSSSAMENDIDDFMKYCEEQMEVFVNNLNTAIDGENIDVNAIAKSIRRKY